MTIASILIDLATLEFSTQADATRCEEIIKQLIEYDKKQQDRLKKLNALEAHGVDNWEWYDDAMKDVYGNGEEDE